MVQRDALSDSSVQREALPSGDINRIAFAAHFETNISFTRACQLEELRALLPKLSIC